MLPAKNIINALGFLAAILLQSLIKCAIKYHRLTYFRQILRVSDADNCKRDK